MVGKKGGEQGGGGGNDPLVGTSAHAQYRGRVQVGTVTRKSRVVWVKYLNYPKLPELERHIIFGEAEIAEAHLQKVRKGKTPPPPKEAR